MSCTASAAWSRHVSSPCYTEHGQRCGAILSGCITTVAMSKSDQLGLRCAVEPNCSGLSARLAGASVTRDCALNTCEPSCMPGVVKPFFIHVVHSPLGAVGYVAAPELSSRGGGRCHVAAPKPTSTGRRGPELRNTWQRRSPTQQGGEVWDRGTRGGSGAHLCREVWSEGTACVAARGCMPCSLS
jgi:hypothetical protein